MWNVWQIKGQLSHLPFLHLVTTIWDLGLPWWLSSKESAYQGRRCRFDPWVGKIPWFSREWQPTPVFCLSNLMDTGAWWATVRGVAKSWTQLSNYTYTIYNFTFSSISSSILIFFFIQFNCSEGKQSQGVYSINSKETVLKKKKKIIQIDTLPSEGTQLCVQFFSKKAVINLTDMLPPWIMISKKKPLGRSH